jgi:hypothetical protein
MVQSRCASRGHGKTMPFDEYVVLMKREARSEYRQYLRTHPKPAQGRLWA